MNPSENEENPQRSVLVIEDDPLNMKMFGAMLAAQGHHVLQATDGARGLELARREHPDLIITDVQMPGISGLEVTRRLKADEDTRDIPILITTAYLLDKEEIRASGCDGFMAKPIAIAEFLELVETMMRAPGATRDID
jgi:two-component system, cell cycle response regulator DivK